MANRGKRLGGQEICQLLLFAAENTLPASRCLCHAFQAQLSMLTSPERRQHLKAVCEQLWSLPDVTLGRCDSSKVQQIPSLWGSSCACTHPLPIVSRSVYLASGLPLLTSIPVKIQRKDAHFKTETPFCSRSERQPHSWAHRALSTHSVDKQQHHYRFTTTTSKTTAAKHAALQQTWPAHD